MPPACGSAKSRLRTGRRRCRPNGRSRPTATRRLSRPRTACNRHSLADAQGSIDVLADQGLTVPSALNLARRSLDATMHFAGPDIFGRSARGLPQSRRHTRYYDATMGVPMRPAHQRTADGGSDEPVDRGHDADPGRRDRRMAIALLSTASSTGTSSSETACPALNVKARDAIAVRIAHPGRRCSGARPAADSRSARA
jgi:hypothetical protein